MSIVLVAAFLGGCATPQLRKDAATATASGAPEILETKIERGRALTIEEIVHLTRIGVPEEVILRNFEASEAVYDLKVADVGRLQAAGVGDAVIDAMLASRQTYAEQGYRYAPFYYGAYRGYGGYPGYFYGGRRHLRRSHYDYHHRRKAH